MAAREAWRRQALGLGVCVLVVSAAYAMSDGGLADLEIGEPAVELVAEEATPPTRVEISTHIEEVATRHGVAPRLVAAIVAVESRFDARAVSRRGAAGLMQLMPATAADLEVGDSFDPRENIDGGVRHLKRLMRRFNNDLPLALAAYNAGEQAVIAHRGIPPYRETRQYVVRVLRRYDRNAAQVVARQFAPPAAPRLSRVSYVTRVVTPVVSEAAPVSVAPAPVPMPAVAAAPPSPPKVAEAP